MNRADLTNRDAWAKFAPDFHICDEAFLRDAATLPLAQGLGEDLTAQLRHDGYFQESGLDFGLDMAAMAATVRALSADGIAPAFAFVYDEFWLPFHRLQRWFEALLGDYAMLPHFWVWNLEPKNGDAGWTPHRDLGHEALLPDGSPKALTAWIPLTSAVPLNGCMYVVPASFDPVYGTPRDKEKLFDYPSIRALPAEPGDVLMWNQALLHWGSRTSPRAREPRISMSVEFQRRDAKPLVQPLLDPRAVIPFEERLKLIARQIYQYRHMHKFGFARRERADDPPV